ATPSPSTTYDPASGTWTVGALAADATATLTLVATVESAGPLVNTATKTEQTEAEDPNPLNDAASVTLNAGTTPDLPVAEAVSNGTAAVGEGVTCTGTVRNRGPSPATDVAVTDVLPAGLTFVSATPSQGTYDSGTGIWTVGTLPATRQATLSLRALVAQAG